MNSTISENKKQHKILFHGKGGEYFGIWIVNLLLSIITLGIYSAWATVKTRRYFYGNTEINGDRFDYHATGLQILIGRVIMAVLFILYVFLSNTNPIAALFIVIVFFALVPYFILRSWRYNAIMSSFRGIRFNYETKFGRGYWVILLLPMLLVVGLYVVTGFLLKLTLVDSFVNFSFSATQGILSAIIIFLFIAGCVAINGIINFTINDLFVNQHSYGKSKFQSALDIKVFMRIAAMACLIFIPFIVLIFAINFGMIVSVFMGALEKDPYLDTSGILVALISTYLLIIVGSLLSYSYSYVAKRNYVYNQTIIAGEVRLISTMTVGKYIILNLTNTLIVIFTLGLGTPIAAVRHAKFVAENTQVEGDLSLLTVIAHTDTAKSGIAEEIVQGFDLNVI